MVSALHYVDFSFKVQASIPHRVSQNGAMSLRLQATLAVMMHCTLSLPPAPGRPALHSRPVPVPDCGAWQSVHPVGGADSKLDTCQVGSTAPQLSF